MKSVKYLFKYVYKGHDCANMEMVLEDGEARDEIKTYLNCRYVRMHVESTYSVIVFIIPPNLNV